MSMFRVRVWVVLLLLFVARSSGAQTTVQVGGVVVAAENRSPVAGAVVTAGSSRVVTDSAGRFTLGVPVGTTSLHISASGFVEQDVQVAPSAPTLSLEIALTRTPLVREEVSVSADSLAIAPTPATITLPPSAVLRV